MGCFSSFPFSLSPVPKMASPWIDNTPSFFWASLLPFFFASCLLLFVRWLSSAFIITDRCPAPPRRVPVQRFSFSSRKVPLWPVALSSSFPALSPFCHLHSTSSPVTRRPTILVCFPPQWVCLLPPRLSFPSPALRN